MSVLQAFVVGGAAVKLRAYLGQGRAVLKIFGAGAAIFPGARAGRGGECIPETGSII